MSKQIAGVATIPIALAATNENARRITICQLYNTLDGYADHMVLRFAVRLPWALAAALFVRLVQHVIDMIWAWFMMFVNIVELLAMRVANGDMFKANREVLAG